MQQPLLATAATRHGISQDQRGLAAEQVVYSRKLRELEARIRDRKPKNKHLSQNALRPRSLYRTKIASIALA
jgi:hypothetical protein